MSVLVFHWFAVRLDLHFSQMTFILFLELENVGNYVPPVTGNPTSAHLLASTRWSVSTFFVDDDDVGTKCEKVRDPRPACSSFFKQHSPSHTCTSQCFFPRTAIFLSTPNRASLNKCAACPHVLQPHTSPPKKQKKTDRAALLFVCVVNIRTEPEPNRSKQALIEY